MGTYIGQYTYEESFREPLLDREGNERSAIRFKLRPIEDWELNSPVTLPVGKQNPSRIKSLREQVQRKERLVREMKRLYNNTCQLCDDRRLQGDDIGYSYVHHIKPLAKEHSGPDIAENVIVLCPNHHDDFDNGMLTIDPNTLEISHDYDKNLTGRTVTLKRGHEIDSKFFAYHNQTIATK